MPFDKMDHVFLSFIAISISHFFNLFYQQYHNDLKRVKVTFTDEKAGGSLFSACKFVIEKIFVNERWPRKPEKPRKDTDEKLIDVLLMSMLISIMMMD